MTQRLLLDLEKQEKDNIDEIIVVDDCSPEPPNIISNLNMRIVQTEQNSGFTLAANLGLDIASADDDQQVVFLISNDVRIHGKFIWKTRDLLSDWRCLIGNRHINWNSGWNTFDDVVYDYLDGHFLATTGRSWRDLGFFDPIYAPGDFEDVDISTAARSKGYRLVSLNNPNIIHLGAQTTAYNPQRQARTLRNKEYFRQKWIK